MAETTTITVRIPVEVRDKLDRLAEATRRSRSFHAAEALAAYADQELDIVEGILRGLDDMKSGRTVPHEPAMNELDAIIERARQKHRRMSA